MGPGYAWPHVLFMGFRHALGAGTGGSDSLLIAAGPAEALWAVEIRCTNQIKNAPEEYSSGAFFFMLLRVGLWGGRPGAEGQSFSEKYRYWNVPWSRMSV